MPQFHPSRDREPCRQHRRSPRRGWSLAFQSFDSYERSYCFIVGVGKKNGDGAVRKTCHCCTESIACTSASALLPNHMMDGSLHHAKPRQLPYTVSLTPNDNIQFRRASICFMVGTHRSIFTLVFAGSRYVGDEGERSSKQRCQCPQANILLLWYQVVLSQPREGRIAAAGCRVR